MTRTALFLSVLGANGDVSLKSGEETNAFLAWKSSKGSPYTPTPIVYGDQFYVVADNGVLSSYDAKTGALRELSKPIHRSHRSVV